MYINLLHLPLFIFSYLFFLFFLSFPFSIFASFIFIDLFPNWHFALLLFSCLCFSQFYSDRYNFWFPLVTGSISRTLFMLDCFYFAYGCICICICVYLVTRCIGVINLCLDIGLFQFCGVSTISVPSFFLLLLFVCFHFFIILIF